MGGAWQHRFPGKCRAHPAQQSQPPQHAQHALQHHILQDCSSDMQANARQTTSRSSQRNTCTAHACRPQLMHCTQAPAARQLISHACGSVCLPSAAADSCVMVSTCVASASASMSKPFQTGRARNRHAFCELCCCAHSLSRGTAVLCCDMLCRACGVTAVSCRTCLPVWWNTTFSR